MKIKIAGFLVAGMMLGVAQGAVWDSTNNWDKQVEDNYSNWVVNSFDKDVFIKGKYRGITTDCADAVYAARIIFAYENELPFSIKDPTGGRKLITNKMSRFDRTSNEIKRLKRFIHYVGGLVSTKSLHNDTYPVKVNREWVRAGGVFSRPRASVRSFFWSSKQTRPGHAELIKQIRETGVVELIGSTVPAAVRELNVTTGLVFLPKNHETGFRYWRLPKHYGMKQSRLPGYSLEQYEMGYEVMASHGGNSERDTDISNQQKRRTLSKFVSEVEGKLKTRDEDKEEMKYRFAQNFCARVNQRVEAVHKAERLRKKLNRCMNENEFDLYSTPSRDKKIKASLKELIKAGTFWGMLTDSSIEKVSKYLNSCGELEIYSGRTITMTEFALRINDGLVSSDPNDPIRVRWGSEESDGSGCKQYY